MARTRHVIEPNRVDQNVMAEFLTALEELERTIGSCKKNVLMLENKAKNPEGFAKTFFLEENIRENVNRLSAAMHAVRKKTSPFLAAIRLASGQPRWKFW